MKNKLLYLSFVLLGFPFCAFANSAIPIVTPLTASINGWFGSILLLFFPIVIIEAFIIKIKLKNNNYWRPLIASLAANLSSMFVGFLFFPVFKSVENIIYKNKINFNKDFYSTFGWFIFILTVNFLLSVFFENLVVKKFFKNNDGKIIKKTIILANVATYLLLFLLDLYVVVRIFIF